MLERVVLTPQERSVKVSVGWKGGQVSALEVERKRRGEPTRVTDEEVVELVRKLAVEGGLDDSQIARVLIKGNKRTAAGLTFTKLRVQSVRRQYQIPRGMGHPAGGPSFTAEQSDSTKRPDGSASASRPFPIWVKCGKLQAVRVARGRRKGWRIRADSTGS